MTTVLIENRQKHRKLRIPLIRSMVKEISKELGLEKSEISILLLDDKGISELNRQYLDRQGPTDVMAFPLYENNAEDAVEQKPDMLGDVVISVETAERQAQDFQEEMIRLLTHGILHLLGFDHETSRADNRKMKTLENRIVKTVSAKLK